MPYAIDLFCGAGGMSEGLLQAGFHILFSSDISEDVEKTYTHRHEQLGLYQGENTYFQRADISSLSGEQIFNAIQDLKIFTGKHIPEIDAIFGGPPCQGFSLAGRRAKNDPRNMLFREYVRIIKEIRPKYVVMENVTGFLYTKLDGFVGVTDTNYPEGSLVTHILEEELTRIGYVVLPVQVLDASEFGVPQRRRRAIFMAYRADQAPISYPSPSSGNTVTVEEAISDLIISGVKHTDLSAYQLNSLNGRTPRVLKADSSGIIFGEPLAHVGPPSNHEVSRHSKVVTQRFSLYREGENTVALTQRLMGQGVTDVLFNYPDLLMECFEAQNDYHSISALATAIEEASADISIVKLFISKKGNRYRYDRSLPATTVLTLPDDFIVPFENRIPTVRELARLQSFDDSLFFKGKRTTGGPRRKIEVPQYTQVGNAVPPLLAKAVAKQVLEALNAEKKGNASVTLS
ncbi:DNA cytosine methyltransferase [Exiguobacterium artemiae]|uniref:DNA cytosine methyltransferase n=1 Tax=Exiguobacterium artemiae TaxID=340145 RepID=UPI003CFDE6D5